MAKKTGEKKSGKLQWFFLIIVIPVLFAAVIGVVILSSFGVNVLDLGKTAASNVPVVSSLLQETEMEQEETEENRSNEVSAEDLTEKETEIATLEQEIESKDSRIRELEEQLETLQIEAETESEKEAGTDSNLRELAQVYENMSAADAANILSEMDNEEILRHMEEMDSEVRADILSEMETETASTLMSALGQ